MVLDGGKGSGRRKEDIKKIHDNWDLIFGNKKDTPMIDEEDNEDYTNDDIDDFDDTCTWCGGCGEGDYDGASCRRCHGTGVEPRERDCDDHDFID
jgi:hypothetical protein